MHTNQRMIFLVACGFACISLAQDPEVLQSADDKILSLLPKQRYRDSTDGMQRVNASIKKLYELGEISYGPLSRLLLKTDSEYQVEQICRVFMNTEGDKSVPRAALVEFLNQAPRAMASSASDWDSGGVRFAAVQALSKIATDDEIPTLMKMLEEKDARSRKAALVGLRRIGAVNQLPELEVWLDRQRKRMATQGEEWSGEQSALEEDVAAIRSGKRTAVKEAQKESPSILHPPPPKSIIWWAAAVFFVACILFAFFLRARR